MYLKSSLARPCATCGAETWALYRLNDCHECMLKRTKKCSACQERKDRSEFYAAKRASDGLKSQCKACHCECSIRTRNVETALQRNAEHMRRARQANPEKFRERERQFSRHRPKNERTAARVAVNSAIRGGTLTRPAACSRCGMADKVTAHHPDYSKPLDVVWLCYPCHGKEHRHV